MGTGTDLSRDFLGLVGVLGLAGVLGLVGVLGSSFGTTMDVSGSRMRVLKQQGNARQEGYRGRLKSPQRDQYHAGKTRHGKSPKIRSKPLGPCFAAGKEHQREYGHGHASPDPRVKASSEKNKVSRPKVHGTRGGRRKRHDRFRWRFRFVASDLCAGARLPDAPSASAAATPLMAIGSRPRGRICHNPFSGRSTGRPGFARKR